MSTFERERQSLVLLKSIYEERLLNINNRIKEIDNNE
jgi:hypothetical protein